MERDLSMRSRRAAPFGAPPGRLWVAALFLLAALALAGCGRATTAHGASGARAVAGGLPAHGDGKTLVATFLDVGQGDSEVVETPSGKTVLIDAGPPGAEQTILAFLRARGVQRLDYVVASHPHEDHIGGMAAVLDALPFGPVIDAAFDVHHEIQDSCLSAIRSHGARLLRGRAGDHFTIDSQVSMDVLAPRNPLFSESDTDWINNNSVAVRITYGRTRLLFLGDMEAEERQRLYDDGADLRADVLKAAHHGSRNGTDPDLLARVHPQAVVMSCGAANDYGHPHLQALQALESANVPFFRTDLNGTVSLTCDSEGHVSALPERTADRERMATPGGTFGRTGRFNAGHERARPTHKPEDSTTGGSASGDVIGNVNSHVYHLPGSRGRLPSPANRVYFHSAAEAEAAGYRPARE